MDNFLIFNFFSDIFFQGLVFGITSTFTSCGFIIPYILGTQKTLKKAFHLVMFLFIGRMFVLMLMAGFSVMLSKSLFLIYVYETNILNYISAILSLIIIFLGLVIFVSGFRKNNFANSLYKWDFILMFGIGLFLGVEPNIAIRVFLSNLTLAITNRFLAITAGFVFAISSFFSVLVVFALVLGWLSFFISKNYPRIYNSIQKICGLVIMYLGIQKIFKIWIIING